MSNLTRERFDRKKEKSLQIDRALHHASSYCCHHRVFVAWALQSALGFTGAAFDNIFSYLDEYQAVKKLRVYIEDSSESEEYKEYRSILTRYKKERIPSQFGRPPPEETNAKEALVRWAASNRIDLVDAEAEKIVRRAGHLALDFGYKSDTQLWDNAMKAVVLYLGNGMTVGEVTKRLATIHHAFTRQPVDDKRCEVCTERNTRYYHGRVAECNSCSQTFCNECRLKNLVSRPCHLVTGAGLYSTCRGCVHMVGETWILGTARELYEENRVLRKELNIWQQGDRTCPQCKEEVYYDVYYRVYHKECDKKRKVCESCQEIRERILEEDGGNESP